MRAYRREIPMSGTSLARRPMSVRRSRYGADETANLLPMCLRFRLTLPESEAASTLLSLPLSQLRDCTSLVGRTSALQPLGCTFSEVLVKLQSPLAQSALGKLPGQIEDCAWKAFSSARNPRAPLEFLPPVPQDRLAEPVLPLAATLEFRRRWCPHKEALGHGFD